MRSITRRFRLAVATGLLAGAAATQGVTLLAGNPQPPADKAPAPDQTPTQQTAATQPPASAPKADQEITPDQMKGVSFEGLTEAQKKLAFSILSDQRCDCGCGMQLATCRAKDSTCTRSLGLATQVLDLVKQGKGRDEIIKTVLSPPSKYVQFDLPIGESPSVGPTDAKVTILYYLDHQWPFCVRVGPTLEELLKQYPKDVRLVYKMHPLPMHASAMIAAQGAVAAQAQGKFLEMHRKLYESSSALSRDRILEIASGLGVDMERFKKDLESEAVKSRIDREIKEAMDIGASGTPAMFVNGRYVSGAKPLEFFKGMVDEELNWAKQKNRPTFTIGKNVSEALPPAAKRTGPDPNKVYDLPIGKAPVVGAKNARVTILHYMDYQWPYCVRVGPTLDQLLKEYPDDVRIAYKQHPLPFHSDAMIAAESAMAASAQGKFLEMHTRLMAPTRVLTRDKILEAAKEIGLDVDRFTKDLDSHAYRPAINEMIDEAMRVGATGTPASFISGKYLSGAQPYEAFKKLVDEELAKVKSEDRKQGAGAPARP